MIDQLFKETLVRNNSNITPERLYIFQTLKSLDGPCTVAKLISITSNKMDRSTVYRTLDLFEKIGISVRVYSGWKYTIELSDMFNPHHHHMTCTNCGKIVSFNESGELLKELKRIEDNNNFRVQSHTLELKGLCRNCC
jgi:Fur family ferric uptake transcriptional regulator